MSVLSFIANCNDAYIATNLYWGGVQGDLTILKIEATTSGGYPTLSTKELTRITFVLILILCPCLTDVWI